jgi:hypothetical protein
MAQIQTSKPVHKSRSSVTIHPDLLHALRDLAEVEEYTLNGLVALLINEGLNHRLNQNGGVR